MVLKLETTTIGGVKWSMNTLVATDGLAAVTQLAAIVGAPVGTVAGAAKKGSVLDLDTGVIGDALAKMSARMAEPETVALAQLLLKDIRKQDKQIDFDIEFAGNYGVMTQLLAWSIKINFTSFFDGNPVLGALLSKAKQSIRGVSTGESGES